MVLGESGLQNLTLEEMSSQNPAGWHLWGFLALIWQLMMGFACFAEAELDGALRELVQ